MRQRQSRNWRQRASALGRKETVSYLLTDVRPHGGWGLWLLPLKLGVTQVPMLDLGACQEQPSKDLNFMFMFIP